MGLCEETGSWLLTPSPDDEDLGPLVAARLVALGGNALGADWVPASLRPPLAAAVRMVDGVHGGAADVGPPAEPATPAGLPDRDVLVVEVRDLADRRPALQMDLADLRTREPDLGVIALLGQDLGAAAGRLGHLT